MLFQRARKLYISLNKISLLDSLFNMNLNGNLLPILHCCPLIVCKKGVRAINLGRVALVVADTLK